MKPILTDNHGEPNEKLDSATKKTWITPDMELISVLSGPAFTGPEGQPTIPNGGVSSYHS